MGSRDRILDAAADVIAERGLARATTKAIAHTAGLSEAMLYRHFSDKHDLFLHVLLERLPPLSAALTALHERVGHGSVRENLERVAAAAIDFYAAGFPMTASLFSEAPLLSAFQNWTTERGTGPHEPVRAVARYLAAERDLGRVAADADPPAVAALLMGACFQRALLTHFTAEPPTSDAGREAPQALVAALCAPLLASGED